MTIEGLRFINSDHFIPPRVVEEVELHLYGLMTSLDEKAANRANQRERICKDFFSESDFHPQTKVYELELKLNPHHVTPYFYVGVEETFFRRLPSLLVRHVIRAGRFVKIEVIDAEIHLACDYIYSTMIPRLGLTAKNGMTVLHWSLKSDARQRIKTLLIPVE